jgi:hypothetical protein
MNHHIQGPTAFSFDGMFFLTRIFTVIDVLSSIPCRVGLDFERFRMNMSLKFSFFKFRCGLYLTSLCLLFPFLMAVYGRVNSIVALQARVISWVE